MNKRDNKKNYISYGFILIFFLVVFLLVNSLGNKENILTYNEFRVI